jgi:acyl carrier protein
VVADVDWPSLRAVVEARRARPMLAELGTSATTDAPSHARLAAQLAALRPAARAGHIEDWLADQCAAVLGHDHGDALPRERGFFDLGMDSMMAVLLAGRLRAELGVKVSPAMIFEQATITGLAARLLDMIDLPASLAPPTFPPPSSAPASTDDGSLGSDDDVLQLIASSYGKLQ